MLKAYNLTSSSITQISEAISKDQSKLINFNKMDETICYSIKYTNIKSFISMMHCHALQPEKREELFTSYIKDAIYFNNKIKEYIKLSQEQISFPNHYIFLPAKYQQQTRPNATHQLTFSRH